MIDNQMRRCLRQAPPSVRSEQSDGNVGVTTASLQEVVNPNFINLNKGTIICEKLLHYELMLKRLFSYEAGII